MKNTQRKYKKIMYTFKIIYFHFQHYYQGVNILQRWHLGECNINYYDRGASFALLVYLFDHVTTRSPQRLQHIAMLPICLHQFAKKTPVVVMMLPVVVSASSGSCQRSPAVVTELSADRHMYVYVLPLGRQ